MSDNNNPYDPCRKCLHWGQAKSKHPWLTVVVGYLCGKGHDLYPDSCPDFTEMRPAKEKP